MQRQLEQEKMKKDEYFEMFKQLSKKLQKVSVGLAAGWVRPLGPKHPKHPLPFSLTVIRMPTLSGVEQAACTECR